LFLFLERAIFIGPSTKKLEHWSFPQWKHLFGLPVAKLSQMYSPIANLLGLYTWGLNFGQTIWDKIEVLLGMPSRTCWEHVGNILGLREKAPPQKKKLPLPHPQKGKNWAHHKGMLSLPIICGHFEQWNAHRGRLFTFQNAWIIFFYLFTMIPKGHPLVPKGYHK
jgi:hypothetical protein